MPEQQTAKIPDIGTIKITRNNRAKRIILKVRPFERVQLTIPAGTNMASALSFAQEKKEWIRERLKEVKRDELQIQRMQESIPDITREYARKILTKRLEYLASKHGFQYNRVFIRRQKTRWGSCSGVNNINLNMYVAGLPAPLIDYVLMHELVHTVIKNHSTEFWMVLGKYVNNPKALREQLKNYQFYLY